MSRQQDTDKYINQFPTIEVRGSAPEEGWCEDGFHRTMIDKSVHI